MSGFGVAGPLSSKLTQLTCGYQGQAANERRKTSAGVSHARSRTRSLGSPAREISPRSWNSSLPTSLDGEEMPKLLNLPKRKPGADMTWGSKGKNARLLAKFRRLFSRMDSGAWGLVLFMAQKMARRNLV